MLRLDHHITITPSTLKSPNLTSEFSQDDLDRIGHHVWEGYDTDLQSRVEWEHKNDSNMDLVLQIMGEKTTPWPGSSNIAFPLITIAVLQFHARAYPAIIQGTSIVRYRVTTSADKDNESKRADRIGDHMSYQFLEEDKDWEEQHDKCLINLAVCGTAFKKSYHSPTRGYNVSELVLARDLVINYWAKSVEECDRKTHTYTMTRNQIHERVLSGAFHDILDEPWYTSSSPSNATPNLPTDLRTGIHPPLYDPAAPRTLLEQHVNLDLDDDGYAEPYIITIDKESHKVLRLVLRVDREVDIVRVESGRRKGQILKITPTEYFTKYGFIPSPDGSIYDLGLGSFLGPLNRTVNTLCNQLIDAGTLANSRGGFLGRGIKLRGGDTSFKPFEWKRVDSTGDDLRKNILELPVGEPSPVLLQLLQLIIDYTNRISGATDMMVGENPGQNTPAQTSRTMVEQGTKIYNAIFKRIWRAMKEEFRKRFILNAIYMPVEQPFGNSGMIALREDYLGDPSAISPVADPHISSDEQRLHQALTLKQMAMTTPGYNRDAVEREVLSAMHIDDVDTIFPGPDKVPPLPNFKLQIEQLKLQARMAHIKSQQMTFISKLEEEKRLNNAKIMDLHANSLKTMSEAQGAIQTGRLSEIEMALNVLEAHDKHLSSQIDLARGAMQDEQSSTQPTDQSTEGSPGEGVSGMAPSSNDQGTP